MKIAWHAIVKNEAAIIERCLDSLLPYVDCGIVVDTGSTDGTQDLITRYFQKFHKPLEYHQIPFINFEQARNEALRHARESEFDWDYLLLADADMELRVKQEPWFFPNGGLAYDMRQVGGALSYANRRLVSRKAGGWYVGCTHEYLDIPSAGVLESADFIDHADGANRPDKLQRDITLLEEALKTETRPALVERYSFYLAQSYFELQKFEKAAKLYKIRTQLGGFEEERWYAQLRYAQCLGHLGDQSGFLWEMLAAYRMRPKRAESLYELAKYFRERGDNFSSLLFSEAGMQLLHAHDDLLFVNDWIYKLGLREEFAICGYYSERHRRTGAKECNKLALAGSEQARSNLYWYLQPLSKHLSSFIPKQIVEVVPPAGYTMCNPSVTNMDGRPVILVRTVNYTINAEGGYDFPNSYNTINDIHTRNFILSLGTDWGAFEVVPPETLVKYWSVRGFEDSRIFEWDDRLWSISTVREMNSDGYCEQVLARFDDGRYTDWKKILPKERRHEKNWMPWVQDGELRFVYRLGTLVDTTGAVVAEHITPSALSHISGGSQVVQVDARSWIALVHEAYSIPGRPNRYYQHRFVSFWPDGRVDRISAPFFFHDKQIEFAAGLAVFGKQLMVSYGIRDCEAWTATMDVDEVIQFIYKDAL